MLAAVYMYPCKQPPSDIPNDSAINKEPSLKDNIIRGLLDCLDVTTEIRILPAMDGDSERGTSGETGNKGSHGWQEMWARLETVCFYNDENASVSCSWEGLLVY